MRAANEFATGAKSLAGKRVALQGLGSVSYYLLEHLKADGAKVVGCDVDKAAIDRAVQKYGIEVVSPESIYDVPCDIFSPSALGATVNAQTLPRIQAKVIAGAANNQLATHADGVELMRLGKIYAPDYVINAGGLINIYYEGHEGSKGGGYNRTNAYAHIGRIGDTVKQILERSRAEESPSHVVADRIAEERVAKARDARR
jgi:leucine dehydrogenase